MSNNMKPPRTGLSSCCTPNQNYYDPVSLALTDDKSLNELCDEGEISGGDVFAARFLRQTASWRGDSKAIRYREVAAGKVAAKTYDLGARIATVTAQLKG